MSDPVRRSAPPLVAGLAAVIVVAGLALALINRPTSSRPVAGASVATATLDPNATPTPDPATATATPDPNATATPVPPPTSTPDPNATATAVPPPTPTPDPLATATPTAVPSPTATAMPPPTATPIPPTATPVPPPTATTVPPPTATPLPNYVAISPTTYTTSCAVPLPYLPITVTNLVNVPIYWSSSATANGQPTSDNVNINYTGYYPLPPGAQAQTNIRYSTEPAGTIISLTMMAQDNGGTNPQSIGITITCT